MKKKILLLIDDLTSGGAQRQLFINAEQLMQNNFDVEVLIYNDELFYEKQLLEIGVKIHKVFHKKKIKRLLLIRKFIRNENFDTVMSYTMTPNFINVLCGLFFRNWKVVVNERSANEIFNLKFFIYRLFYIFADVIISNSYKNMEIIIKDNILLKRKKTLVLYNSINLDKFNLKQDYIFKKNGNVNILVLSSHQYIKNLKGLILAISLLDKEKINKLHIDWYGAIKDSSYIEMKKLILSLELKSIFDFHEPINEVTSLIQNHDVIGLFSFYEGFPNSIIEGMACGKPVICSEVSDIPKIINKEFLFSPTDYNDIKIVIEKIIDSTCNELEIKGLYNRCLAKNYFDQKKNIKLLIGVI